MSASASAAQDPPDTPQPHAFEADVSRLLGIVANALYSHHDVFLRELISNASDACDRLRYESVSNPDLARLASNPHIRVTHTPATRLLRVVDTGIGMDRAELIEHLGTIAHSGTARLADRLKGAGTPAADLIGQFGVGFYACFMVADRVTVTSRRAGQTQIWTWESDGSSGFTTAPAQAQEAAFLDAPHGTVVALHLKPEASEFLVDEKIRSILQRYSDHINIPIYLGPACADEKPVNAVTALWLRPKADITDLDYRDFYRHITTGGDTPLLTAHWKAEGAAEFSALLYVPELRPWDLFDPARRHAVKLYVRRVFITDQCEGLVYPWLRFLRGVIDCADLPLNISRETLQFNPILEKIRRAVARRILGDLERLSTEDPTAFATFWGQFGPVVKEGLYDAHALRDEIFKVCRFRSTHEDGKTPVRLSDYVARMKPDQKSIYTLAGQNMEALLRSPQIEGFRARGIEVLFFTDTIDDFWIQVASDYQGHPFQPVTKGAFEPGEASLDSQVPQTAPDGQPASAPDTAALIERLNAVLSA
ncbi:MAG TPA: molecular chaperone HtpG, partial [Alphaproteobacteria bacterium]|nr:molecular chaperone HtpG [Alphaproteobacteria bacterium]